MTLTTTPTVPLTLLQAVNEMLDAIGKAQVSSLSAVDSNEEVQKAVNTINDVAVQVQSRGWDFNTDRNYPLVPDAKTGQIVLPPNAVFKGISERSSYRFATERQGKLWDRKNFTYAWINGTDGVSTNPDPLNGPLYIDVLWLFVFEDLPQPIRWLITAQAGRQFGVGRVPDLNTFKFTDTVYEDALALAQSWDVDSQAAFAEDNPHFWFMRKR